MCQSEKRRYFYWTSSWHMIFSITKFVSIQRTLSVSIFIELQKLKLPKLLHTFCTYFNISLSTFNGSINENPIDWKVPWLLWAELFRHCTDRLLFNCFLISFQLFYKKKKSWLITFQVKLSCLKIVISLEIK